MAVNIPDRLQKHIGLRDNWLEKQGYRVLRFWDNDVLLNIQGILEPSPSSPPLKGGNTHRKPGRAPDIKSSCKSCHCGFAFSIRPVFHLRLYFFNLFSLLMAFSASGTKKMLIINEFAYIVLLRKPFGKFIFVFPDPLY